MTYYTTIALPWFLPGVGLSVVIALSACRPFGRLLEVRPSIAWALVVGFGIIIAATLTPYRGTIGIGEVVAGTCDVSRVGLAPVAQLLRLNDTSLNIALFIPFGIAIGLLPPTRLRMGIVLAAIALPFGIEAIQLLVPILGRGCQSADVIDNLTGLMVGFVVGAGLRLARR